MENRVLNDNNYKRFIELGYRFVGNGYMHLIFEKDNCIYKFNRSTCKQYSDLESFEVEMKAMNYLYNKGFPTPKVFSIIDKGAMLENSPVLVEEKVYGKLYKRNNIPEYRVLEIFNFLENVSREVVSSGVLFRNVENTWIDFLEDKIEEAISIAKEFNLKNYIDSCSNAILSIDNCLVSSFLIMDPNEENYFFDENGVCALIDVDHPLGGELFYQWGLYAFLRPEQFEILLKNRSFTSKEINRIYNFALLHAYVDLYFRFNTIDDAKELEY